MTRKTIVGTCLMVAVVVGASTSSVIAGPTTYGLLTTILVPTGPANVQPGGAFTSFDISYADPVTGNIFIADRSNASVDIFSGSSLTFLGRATGFTGQQATTSASGAGWRPDGHLGRGNHALRR